jgi:DNA adenine methylase
MSQNLTSKLLAMVTEDEVRDQYVRAPMGWPGAKSRSIKELLAHLPYRNTFVDVFGGTGSVLLARNPSPLDVYNDKHSGLVAFYRCIRDRLKCAQMIERLEVSPPLSREEFIWSRDTWKQNQLDDVERAARWYYSLVTSFNQKGWSFGRAVKGKGQGQKMFNNIKLFWPLHNRMRNAQIENQDWRMILKDYSKGGKEVVFYLDPPYEGTFGIYDHELAKEEHREICERIQHLNGAFVALSGYDHPGHTYNSFNFWTSKITWEVPISMTGMAFTESNHLVEYEGSIKRGIATECLWIYDQ